MSRNTIVAATCVAGMLIVAVGCVGQPLLSSQLGLLPGPPLSLLTEVTTTNALLSQLTSGNIDIFGLLTGTSTGQTTSNTSSSTNTSTSQGQCPTGQKWVGTVTLGGVPLTVNACVPDAQAAQYGVE